MRKSALVVLSGGQDSATCLALASNTYLQLHCVTFDYEQRHRKEIESARALASLFNASHEVIKVPALVGNQSSGLTNAEIDLKETDGVSGLPKSFVPGRNLIFLAQAAAIALTRGIKDIITGVCQTDFSGYPDCRRVTIDAIQLAINLGNENLVRTEPLTIHTPLMYLSKAQTVELADRTPNGWAALSLSWTCYEGGAMPCGICPACVLRAKGFAEAGFDDPALIERV